MPKTNLKKLYKQLDWTSILIPLLGVLTLSIIFIIHPQGSKNTLETIRQFLTDTTGIYYALLGLGIFIFSLYIAFSKYGKIKLGDGKQEYTNFQWGIMIFTSTMAADIIFYSLCEWALYSNETFIKQQGNIQKWASTYPLFHWGPIAWSFYIILAVAFGFMLHVKCRKKQKFSEACRPILGKYTDTAIGKLIDLIAIFSLLAGTATTFSLATPLLSNAISSISGIKANTTLTISILAIIAIIYTLTIMFGMRGISKLAKLCVALFGILLLYFLILGGETKYILETGFSSLGNLTQNFISMATWLDPLRETSFPQNWTIYYWAYWMVWCVATPFFIGKISKGRKIKNIILNGYAWGLAGTFTSFIILGNYGLAQELKHGINISKYISKTGNQSDAILKIFSTLPMSQIAIILLVITMILFYATTFDALTMVISSYSYKTLTVEIEPAKIVRIFWSIMFIIFPIALIFSENSMRNLQSVAIIMAFPIGFIMILIIASFMKEAKSIVTSTE